MPTTNLLTLGDGRGKLYISTTAGTAGGTVEILELLAGTNALAVVVIVILAVLVP